MTPGMQLGLLNILSDVVPGASNLDTLPCRRIDAIRQVLNAELDAMLERARRRDALSATAEELESRPWNARLGLPATASLQQVKNAHAQISSAELPAEHRRLLNDALSIGISQAKAAAKAAAQETLRELKGG